MIYRYETLPALGMTWPSEFRSQGEGLAYILRPEPVMYSPLPQPAREGFSLWRFSMKTRSKIALATGLGVVSASSQAAISTGVSTAMGDAVADVGTMGGLALLIVVAVATFRYLKRAP